MSDPQIKPTFQQLLSAEFFATFALVFTGCGAVVIDSIKPDMIGHIGISLTFGLIVLAMIYSVGEISGTHINPAVTIGFWAAGRFPGRLVAPYIAAQVAGAAVASATLWMLFPDLNSHGQTVPAGSWLQSFILEVLLTAILMFVILCVSTGAKEKGITAGVVVGAVIALEALFAGPISGASMNPARSLGPAIFSGHLREMAIYIPAPIVGSLVSILAYRCVRSRENPPSE